MSEAAPGGGPAAAEPGAADVATPSLVADVNEPKDLLALLAARGVEVDCRRLAPADFVVGRLAVERKTVGDFHASMIDKRLFEQLTRMLDAYPDRRVALLLEGDLSFFEERRQPRASWGALAAIAVDLGVAVLPTPSKEASADLLTVLARRAARGTGGERGGGGGAGGSRHDVRFRPRALAPDALQRHAVQGLPGIGDVVSDNLLEHFGSVRRVFAATERELLRVPGVGKGRAREVAGFLDAPYRGRQGRLPGAEDGAG